MRSVSQSIMILIRRLFCNKFDGTYYSRRLLSRSTYDVVIIGGGMVGCALAASAGSSKHFEGKSILLVDSAHPKIWAKGAPSDYDIRVSAINPASVKLMEKIGAWRTVNDLRKPQRLTQLRVWDACSSSSIHFEHPNMEENVAYIIENTALVTAFWRRMQQFENVETFTDGGSVKQCILPSATGGHQLASVELENGTTIKAKLLVGADGFNSFVRKAMKVHELNWQYRQKGIVGTLQIQESENENNVAWQRFTPSGPIALLPLDKTSSSLVWTTTPSEADRLVSLNAGEFLDELNHALFSTDKEYPSINQFLSYIPNYGQDYLQFPPRIVGLRSRLAAFPLGFQHATNYVACGVALVGDAAHRVHPLAGQGVNLGFGDVSSLIEHLEQAIERGEDIGAFGVLRDYESQRQWHNLSVMMTVDGLNRLYATSSPPIVLIRSLGLNIVNQCAPLKDFFMKRASA